VAAARRRASLEHLNESEAAITAVTTSKFDSQAPFAIAQRSSELSTAPPPPYSENNAGGVAAGVVNEETAVAIGGLSACLSSSRGAMGAGNTVRHLSGIGERAAINQSRRSSAQAANTRASLTDVSISRDLFAPPGVIVVGEYVAESVAGAATCSEPPSGLHADHAPDAALVDAEMTSFSNPRSAQGSQIKAPLRPALRMARTRDVSPERSPIYSGRGTESGSAAGGVGFSSSAKNYSAGDHRSVGDSPRLLSEAEDASGSPQKTAFSSASGRTPMIAGLRRGDRNNDGMDGGQSAVSTADGSKKQERVRRAIDAGARVLLPSLRLLRWAALLVTLLAVALSIGMAAVRVVDSLS
jgi:hypothetical protein